MLIDTHTHLFLPEFDEDRDQVVQKAEAAGVKKMLLPNIDLGSLQAMLDMSERYPKLCKPMIGLHPCSVTAKGAEEVDELFRHFKTGTYCAIGEIGIDLYWDKTFQKEQEEVFRKQLQLAIEYELPAVIHTRNSFTEAFSIVKEMKEERLTGVFHCFGGTLEEARGVIELGGFYMGIGGVLTFKNSGVDKVIADVPLDYLVLETDAPYLTPAPHRGSRNESSYLTLIAKKLAEVKNVSLEEVEAVTTANANRLFKLSDE